jgi:Berberine and berberine like
LLPLSWATRASSLLGRPTRPPGLPVHGSPARRACRCRRAHGVSDRYEATRKVNNGSIDKRPALIARCRGADDVGEAVRAACGPNYDRLVEVKRHYDPDNVFHLNHNVDPGGGAVAAREKQRQTRLGDRGCLRALRPAPASTRASHHPCGAGRSSGQGTTISPLAPVPFAGTSSQDRSRNAGCADYGLAGGGSSPRISA